MGWRPVQRHQLCEGPVGKKERHRKGKKISPSPKNKGKKLQKTHQKEANEERKTQRRRELMVCRGGGKEEIGGEALGEGRLCGNMDCKPRAETERKENKKTR